MNFVLILSFSALFISGSIIAILKWHFQGRKYSKFNRIDGKIVIITGAHRGIGKETARELAGRGGIIYMTSYDLKKCETGRREIIEDTKNSNVFSRHLDLASFNSIRQFVEEFKNDHDYLDILINNASVKQCPLMRTKDGLEMQLGVNYMGHFLLTVLLANQLKASRPSRILNISSIAYKSGRINVDDLNSEKSYDSGEAFDQSKLANVLFTDALSKRLSGTGVTVNSVDPGFIENEIQREMIIFDSLLGRYIMAPLIWPFLKTVQYGAQNIIYSAIDTELERVTGKYISNLQVEEITGRGKDEAAATFLWRESERLTGLSSSNN